ncbi:MAG TPA: TadE/TadG family type IV pilus assembly protein [Sphingobium sp.]|nr:TadE/TadG family type IV pilus assembly protein [Sphingobium sp.]
MSGFLHRFWRDRHAGPAAEFALVAPLLILFLLGIVDVGRLLWTWNQAEKATQMGVRFAAVTNLINSDLKDFSYAVAGLVPQGDVVPQADFGGVTCTSTSCTCKNVGGTCPFGMTRDGATFNLLVARMTAFKSDIAVANVLVDYDYSGLGFSGDPNGPDVAPLITVRLQNLTFTPISLVLFGASLNLPGFSATLSMEDGDGTNSN